MATEVCEMKRFQHLRCLSALPEAADNPAILSSRTDSVEFCMTLTLSSVSKMEVTSEWYHYDPPFHKSQ